MKTNGIIQIIEELNEHLEEDSPEMYECGLGYTYSTNGFVDVVKFCGYVLYDSENVCDYEVEEVGGLKRYIVLERNKFIGMLTKLRIFE